MYDELIPKLPKLNNNYSELDDTQILELVFEYVQQQVEIPQELISRCKTNHTWGIIEPLLGDINEDLLEEFV